MTLTYDDIPEDEQDLLVMFLPEFRKDGKTREGQKSADPTEVVLEGYIMKISDLADSAHPSAKVLLNVIAAKTIVSGMPNAAERAPTEEVPLDADELNAHALTAATTSASGLVRDPDEMVARFGQVNTDPPPAPRKDPSLPTPDPPKQVSNPTLSPPTERMDDPPTGGSLSSLSGPPPVSRVPSLGAVDMTEWGVGGPTPAPARPRKAEPSLAASGNQGPTPLSVQPSGKKSAGPWEVKAGEPEPDDQEANSPTARSKLEKGKQPAQTASAPAVKTAATPVIPQKNPREATMSPQKSAVVVLVGIGVLVLAFAVLVALVTMVPRRPANTGVVPATVVPETRVETPLGTPVDKVPEINVPQVDLSPTPTFTVSSSYEAGGKQTCVVGALTGAAFTRIGTEKLVLCGKGVVVKGNVITVQGAELTPKDLSESMRGQTTMADKEYTVKGVTVYCQTDGGAVNNQQPCTLK